MGTNYGLIKEDELAHEDFELNPLSLYAKSKFNAEKYILSLKNKTDINPNIAQIVGISISYKENTGFYIPVVCSEKSINLSFFKKLFFTLIIIFFFHG